MGWFRISWLRKRQTEVRRGDCVKILKGVEDDRGYRHEVGSVATVYSAGWGKVEVYWTNGFSCSLRWGYATLKQDEVEKVAA